MTEAKRYVLDTSALVALLEDEEGADRVESLMRLGDATLIPVVALLEVYYVSLRKRGEPEAARRYALFVRSGVRVLREMDDTILVTAARLKAGHRLSLADAIAAAYAIGLGATLVHKDPEFEPIADEVAQEALPYKRPLQPVQ